MSESTSETSGSTSSDTKRKRRWKISPGTKVGLCIAAAIAALIFLVYLTTAGRRSGVEFSPDDFSRRSYLYNKMPIFGYHIGGGVEYENLTSPFDSSLIAPPGLISVRTSQPKVWDLVRTSTAPADSHDCDASILCGYLDMVETSGTGSYWTKWNDEHPNSAKVLWPAIANLARNGVYLGVPDVMRVAIGRLDDDASLFETSLNATLADVYIEQAISERENGNQESAITMLTKSIEALPTVRGYKMRAEVNDALGKSSRAERDRVDASRLE